jgi:hypothetical protein
VYPSGYMQDTCKIHQDTSGYVSDRNPPQNDRKPPRTPETTGLEPCRVRTLVLASVWGGPTRASPSFPLVAPWGLREDANPSIGEEST